MQRRVITVPELEACLAEMSEAGRAGIEALVETVMMHWQQIPNHKQMGPAMALEMMAAVLVFMSLTRSQRYERLNW